MKKYLPLILVVILASVLRLGMISVFPSGLNADEAALGYNAYSLLLTGRDEHGNILPVNLESFGDYKPAMYSYLLVPLIKVFGLKVSVVRFPSALFGVLAVGLIYYLSMIIFRNRLISIISSLFLSISPWHLHFSRGAWEVNISTTLLLLGTVLFLRWTKNSRFLYFIFCLIVFSLSMYTYQSARILAPSLGLGLAVLYRDHILNRLRQSSIAFIVLILLLIPLSLSLVLTPAASRAGGVGLLADPGPLNFVNELRGQHSGSDVFLGRLLHNRPVIYSIQFVKNYLSHFDGDFLFVNGDEIQRNKVPETGLLYFTDFILLLFGLVYLSLFINRKSYIIILWLFVAPLASAMTFQVPHALRAQAMVVPLSLISAAGIYQLFKLFSGYKKLFLLLIFFAYSWQFARYLHEYYVHYPRVYPAAWEYGFDQVAAYAAANSSRYDRVLITDKYDQPYILMLFYLRYDPRLFQSDHQLTARDKYNFSTVTRFGKYVFTDTSWDRVRDDHGSLVIAAADDIPPVGVNIVKTIDFPNGLPAFKIVSN